MAAGVPMRVGRELTWIGDAPLASFGSEQAARPGLFWLLCCARPLCATGRRYDRVWACGETQRGGAFRLAAMGVWERVVPEFSCRPRLSLNMNQHLRGAAEMVSYDHP